MAEKILQSRIMLCLKTETEWSTSGSAVLKRGEVGVWVPDSYPTDKTLRTKIGDGETAWSGLPWATLSEAEITQKIQDYHKPASKSSIGEVIIGDNINVDVDGKISVNTASTSTAGIVQLSDSTNSSSSTLAATAKAVGTAYGRADAAYNLADAAMPKAGGTFSGNVSFGSGKTLTVNDPTENLHAANKKYVDAEFNKANTSIEELERTVDANKTATDKIIAENKTAAEQYANAKLEEAKEHSNANLETAKQYSDANLDKAKAYTDSTVAEKIAASNAMIFKGTLGTGGTVTSLPTSASQGDTYKVVTKGTYAGQSAKVGDLFIALKDSPTNAAADWAYVPTGDETETYIRYSSTEDSNLTTEYKSDRITLGEAAIKQVDKEVTTESLSGFGTSSNLPTSNRVAAYIRQASVSHAGTADSATSATEDSEGQNIASTYIKEISGNANSTTISYTKGDGTPGSFQVKDTTYDVANSSTLGLVKSSTGHNTVTVANDGKMSVETVQVSSLVENGTVLVLNGNF